MLESEPIKEEKAVTKPAEPNEMLSLNEQKRVKKGLYLGLGIFALLIVVLIILVNSSVAIPTPIPPKPMKKNLSSNPFVVMDNTLESPRVRVIMLFNNRTKLEAANLTTPLKRRVEMNPKIKEPQVKNTTENREPDYVRVTFSQLDDHLLNVHYDDPVRERWKVPDFFRENDPYHTVSQQISPPQFDPVIANPRGRFEWAFYGKNKTGLPLITTQTCRLQYFDKYIEFEARLQSDHIFGMGERLESFVLKNDNYSLWNFDFPYEYDNGDTERGTYSSHPFFLNRLENKKDFIGVFMKNSNAMIFSFWRTSINGTFINFKMIGGVIDLFIFHAAEPDYILKKYHSVIGRPYLPPLWAMGFQQARKGYDLNAMKTVVTNYQHEEIPIDAIWADQDLNQNYKTFTVDPTKFKDIKEWVKTLHDPEKGINMRFVAIANPALKKEAGYKYYDEAIKEDCVIRSALHYNQPFEGRTIADTSIWLDYFLHSAVLVWAGGLQDMHDLTDFDGVWIYDAEPSNVCDGECSQTLLENDQIPNPNHNASEFDYIQYRPTLDRLETATFPMAAYHCCDDVLSKHYNTHNLFGLQVASATFDSLHGLFEDKRFLVASRSTWPGSGKVSSHWLGENYGSWDSMIGSVPGMLNFNMFGIPHVGAPIGGFFGNVSPELLARWYELGCFSPLMLAYTNSNNGPKEAYAEESVKAYIKDAIKERYSLLQWMYTKMFESFLWGGPVIHPLFFEFPENEELYKREIVDRTFMWSKTLYVIPVFINNQRRTKAFLPNWRWYDLRTREIIADYKTESEGEYYYFEQPVGTITVLVKGGSIIVYQRDVHTQKIMNVEDLKKIPALIIVAPDHTNKAQGTLVVDSEGIRPHPDPTSNTYRHYSFTYYNQIFRINKLAGFDFHEVREYDYFWEVLILDVFDVHMVSFACMMDTDLNRKELEFSHTMGTRTISIHDRRDAKMPMYKLETIVWGTVEQHDFCKFGIQMEYFYEENEGRTMIAEIATKEPEAYQSKFELKASILTDKIISMQMYEKDKAFRNWIVPDVVDEQIRKTFKTHTLLDNSGFRFSSLHVPFYFEMADPTDHRDFIFTTRNLDFVYVRNFIQIKMMFNGRHLFGMGERVGKFELADGLYSLWNKDQMVEETGIAPGNNLYGSHPFMLIHLHDPRFFAGLFFLTSNPLDVKIRHVGMQTQASFVFSGGIIDAFFFQKGSADEVLKNYHYIIGAPVALPYWAFGYHQSRWGYKDIEHLRDVVNKFEINQIPLDGVWMDKDYMQDMRIFTINENKWHGLAQFVKELHEKGKHFVPILDPGIAIDPSYALYQKGLELGIYILASRKGEPLKGVTWPGYSVWIDFIHPTATRFWEDQLLDFYEKVPFDGIWLDMNEPSNFCDGDCQDELHYNYYFFPLDFYDDLFYNPTHLPLEQKTLSMEAVHSKSDDLGTEFNYHNLYSYYQSKVTMRFFTDRLKQRPFIVSSGTFPGQGHFSSHWLGDNWASWQHLEYSIAGIFNFQMYGIPFVGADICGYSGNTTVNLCGRWMQLGAFYPFMRNHNGPEHAPHEPFTDPKLMQISIKAIRMRYSLARYIYSEYTSIARHGGTIFKPVLFDFPEDKFLYSILDTTIMFGNAIRFTPVLEDGISTLESYFPNWDWYDLNNLAKVMSYNRSVKTGKNLTLICPLENGNLNVHIKGGSILAYQPSTANDPSVTTIIQLLDHPVELLIIPDHNGVASGNLYYDDEHPKDYTKDLHDISLTLVNSTVTVKIVSQTIAYKYPKEDNRVSVIYVLNAGAFRDTKCAKFTDSNNANIKLEYTYDSAKEILKLDPKDNKMILPNVTQIMWSNDPTC